MSEPLSVKNEEKIEAVAEPQTEAVPPVTTLSYSLTAEDYFTCLKTGRVFKTRGTRAIIETIILAVIGLGYLGSYLFYQRANSCLLLAIVSAVFIGVIWILPDVSMRSSAKAQASDKIFETSVYPDRIVIGQGSGQWTIPLNGTVAFWETEALFILETPENRMTALPKSRINRIKLAEVRELLYAHTIHGVPKRRRR